MGRHQEREELVKKRPTRKVVSHKLMNEKYFQKRVE